MFLIHKLEGNIALQLTIKAETFKLESLFYVFRNGAGDEVARVRFDVVTTIIDATKS